MDTKTANEKLGLDYPKLPASPAIGAEGTRPNNDEMNDEMDTDIPFLDLIKQDEKFEKLDKDLADKAINLVGDALRVVEHGRVFQALVGRSLHELKSMPDPKRTKAMSTANRRFLDGVKQLAIKHVDVSLEPILTELFKQAHEVVLAGLEKRKKNKQSHKLTDRDIEELEQEKSDTTLPSIGDTMISKGALKDLLERDSFTQKDYQRASKVGKEGWRLVERMLEPRRLKEEDVEKIVEEMVKFCEKDENYNVMNEFCESPDVLPIEFLKRTRTFINSIMDQPPKGRNSTENRKELERIKVNFAKEFESIQEVMKKTSDGGAWVFPSSLENIVNKESRDSGPSKTKVLLATDSLKVKEWLGSWPLNNKSHHYIINDKDKLRVSSHAVLEPADLARMFESMTVSERNKSPEKCMNLSHRTERSWVEDYRLQYTEWLNLEIEDAAGQRTSHTGAVRSFSQRCFLFRHPETGYRILIPATGAELLFGTEWKTKCNEYCFRNETPRAWYTNKVEDENVYINSPPESRNRLLTKTERSENIRYLQPADRGEREKKVRRLRSGGLRSQDRAPRGMSMYVPKNKRERAPSQLRTPRRFPEEVSSDESGDEFEAWY